MGESAEGTISWQELLDEARVALATAGMGVPEQEARWLVEEASGLEGAELYGRLVDLATERGVARLDAMMARRLAGEPIQYVLGRWPFRTLDLAVDRRALIPRPETEQVVGFALDELDRCLGEPESDGGRVVAVDLGTGTGAVALSIAAERAGAEVIGTEHSPAALALARANLTGLGGFAATRVRLVEGDWFDALSAELVGRVALIVSNPPYIAATDELPRSVSEWEPTEALVPGDTGLESIELIVREAPRWLSPGGALVVEIGADQGPTVESLARAAGFAEVMIRQDLAGHDRALVARLGSSEPEPDQAAKVLRRGGVVLLPTDTVYGIGALPSVAGATAKLFGLKDRSAGRPLAVLVADSTQALELVETPSGTGRALMDRFWPGPVTLVLRRSAAASGLELGGDSKTIGVRCPDHDLIRRLAAAVGPIATTSANRHGEPTPSTAGDAAAALNGEVGLVLDGGELNGTASTVVDLTGDSVRVLREGSISRAEVEQVAATDRSG